MSVDISKEQSLISSNLALIKNIWAQRFYQFGSSYNEANKVVSQKLQMKNQDKVLIGALAKIADLALKPLGVYGAMAQVAVAGLKELASLAVSANDAVQLAAPSPLTFSMDILQYSEKIFEPLLRYSARLAATAVHTSSMDSGKFTQQLNKLLTSPVWYPPDQLSNYVIQERMEIAIWAMYFDYLSRSGFSSADLRFLSDIVPYLATEKFSSADTALWRWERYPTPVSQGGLGGWDSFLDSTSMFWSRKLSSVTDLGWLLPMPNVPDWAKVKTSPNWVVPKTATFKAPTASGKASIRVEGVEQTTVPSIKWSEIPALKAA